MALARFSDCRASMLRLAVWLTAFGITFATAVPAHMALTRVVSPDLALMIVLIAALPLQSAVERGLSQAAGLPLRSTLSLWQLLQHLRTVDADQPPAPATATTAKWALLLLNAALVLGGAAAAVFWPDSATLLNRTAAALGIGTAPWDTLVPAMHGIPKAYPHAGAEGWAALGLVHALCWWSVLISAALGIVHALFSRHQRRAYARVAFERIAKRLPPHEALALRQPNDRRPAAVLLLAVAAMLLLALLVAGGPVLESGGAAATIVTPVLASLAGFALWAFAMAAL